MIRCQKCGQTNSQGSNFCRFCGDKFNQLQQNKPKPNLEQTPFDDYDQNQRRPYSWQTDEIQIKEQSARPTQQINKVRPIANPSKNVSQQFVSPPFNSQQQQNQQLQPQYQNTLSAGYHCPFCNSNAVPIVVKKVSPTGWAVFTVLLITTFIFFWVGLLIQEERRICPKCKMQVG